MYLNKIAIPLFLVLVNFVIKLFFIDSMSISGDEAFSIFHAQMDIPSIIAQLSHGNNPPLDLILLHYWIKYFGISPTSVRFLSLLFSSFTVFFVYLIGKGFFNKRVAIVAALIYTFSSYTIIFAHEARAYPLFALLTTMSMYAFYKVIEGRRLMFYMGVLIFSNILLAYTHFLGLFVPAIQLLCCIIFAQLRKERLLQIFSALVILAIAYLPYLKTFSSRVYTSVQYGTWLRPINFESAYLAIWSFCNQPIVAVIFICSLLAGLLKLIIRRGQYISIYAPITTVWFAVPFMFMFFISLKYLPFNVPIFQDRYLIFTSIPYFILVAVAFDYLFDSEKYSSLAMTVPILLMLFTYNPNPDNKMHAAVAVKKVEELKTKNSIVYISPAYFSVNFAYYYNQNYFKQYATDTAYRKMDSCLRGDKVFPINNFSIIDTNKCNNADKIIFFDVMSDFLLPDNHINSYLSSHYTMVGKYNYPTIYSVSVFKKNKQP